MSLEYCLVENKLTADQDDCMARTQDVRTVGIEELTARITGRGMSLTDTEVQAVLNELSHAINSELQSGNAVATPFVRINPSIGGVFTNADDVFDPNRHSVRLNASIGTDISVDTTKLTTKKVKADVSMPEITRLKDYQTQRENEVLTRNGTVEIKGFNLKIDPSDTEQGVFISNQGQEVRVEMYMLNKPSHLIFLIPNDAPGGEVTLTVKNKQHKSNKLRSVSFPETVILQ